mgnify:FL=1
MAKTAQSIINNSNFSGGYANAKLAGAINIRNGANGVSASAYAVGKEMNQIGVELMRAHVNAVNTFGSPSAGQIAAYHFQVFAAHGLPNTTFGGALFTGTEAEAALTSPIWMGCP